MALDMPGQAAPQPLYVDRRGRLRFVANPIVAAWAALWEAQAGGRVEADLVAPDGRAFPLADRDQFVQLRGWTLDRARAAGLARNVVTPAQPPRSKLGLAMPLQPLFEDDQGWLRFKGNALVMALLERRGDLTDLRARGIGTADHWEQMAQLVAYSYSGSPSYLSDRTRSLALDEWKARPARLRADDLAQRWPQAAAKAGIARL